MFKVGDLINYPASAYPGYIYEVINAGSPAHYYDLQLVQSDAKFATLGEIFLGVQANPGGFMPAALYKKPERIGHPLTKIFK